MKIILFIIVIIHIAAAQYLQPEAMMSGDDIINFDQYLQQQDLTPTSEAMMSIVNSDVESGTTDLTLIGLDDVESGTTELTTSEDMNSIIDGIEAMNSNVNDQLDGIDGIDGVAFGTLTTDELESIVNDQLEGLVSDAADMMSASTTAMTCKQQEDYWFDAECACGGSAGGVGNKGSTAWCNDEKQRWKDAGCFTQSCG